MRSIQKVENAKNQRKSKIKLLFLFIFYCTGILYMLLYSLSAKKFLTIRGSTQVWLKGAVLKTARGFIARGGSNPSSSAIILITKLSLQRAAFFVRFYKSVHDKSKFGMIEEK